jgi:hypothetical protein
LHATPSVFASASGSVTSPAATSTPASASATPAAVPHARTTSGTAGPAPAGKERKKRKRSAAMVEDEIDTLFEGALGRKVARGALVVEDSRAALESTPLRIAEAVTKQEKRVDKNADCGLGAVVDAIKAAPKGEGKKKRVRRPG